MQWNDAIHTMNKRDSLCRLFTRLTPICRNGNATVIIYSTNNTISLSEIRSLDDLKTYINNAGADMFYIKTIKGDWQIYLDNYDTFTLDSDTLTIKFYNNKETKITF